ncbi:MAG: acyl-CoA/acyl-ACP dehydrogenase [Rhodospirillales bacterium]|nr:acyl-CoA/acyl-ACP dehydrogenase [Rhodospirillales bacterium]
MDATIQQINLIKVIEQLGDGFAARVTSNDQDDLFVAENFAELKQNKMFSAMVPVELGGGGASHSQMCEAVRKIATYCGSTALTFSMHQHIISAAVWNYQRGNPGKLLLEKVAANELILISTGATDWLGSNGDMQKTEDGYIVNAKKYFASGCPAGDMLITSAPFDDPELGSIVMHFPVPMSAEGVSIEENWKAMGMRATGSHCVVLENVFVPETAIALKRPAEKFHPVWNTVLGVALPLIMSTYAGVAEKAAENARQTAKGKTGDAARPYLLGEMENALTTAKLAQQSMVALADDLNFDPCEELTNEMVKRKTITAKAVIETTTKALEASGGPGYIRGQVIERLVRDSFACQFHPMQEKRQILFTGRMAMGLPPIDAGETLQPEKA